MSETDSGEGGWQGGIIRRGDYEISTERNRLDRAVILNFLSESYWASDVAPEQILSSIANALPFGVYHMPTGRQAGFARVVTDMTRFAWVSDVFVVEAHRGHGIGKFIMEAVLAYPPLADVYNWTLGTDDAHGLYEQFGFRAVNGGRMMQLRRDRLAPR